MISKTIAISLLFCASLCAEPLSNHNEPHAGIQAGIDRLAADGCTRFQITRSGQYILNSTTDADAYELAGSTITVKCTRYAQPAVTYHKLQWGVPTTRTDGTVLLYDELSHYELESFAGVINVGLATNYTIGDVGTDQRDYRIRTVLKSGEWSAWSETLTLGAN